MAKTGSIPVQIEYTTFLGCMQLGLLNHMNTYDCLKQIRMCLVLTINAYLVQKKYFFTHSLHLNMIVGRMLSKLSLISCTFIAMNYFTILMSSSSFQYIVQFQAAVYRSKQTRSRSSNDSVRVCDKRLKEMETRHEAHLLRESMI